MVWELLGSLHITDWSERLSETQHHADLWLCCAYWAALHTQYSLTPEAFDWLRFSNRDYVKQPLTHTHAHTHKASNCFIAVQVRFPLQTIECEASGGFVNSWLVFHAWSPPYCLWMCCNLSYLSWVMHCNNVALGACLHYCNYKYIIMTFACYSLLIICRHVQVKGGEKFVILLNNFI